MPKNSKSRRKPVRGWEVCGVTGSGEEGIALIKSADPDLVILSLFLKGFDGFTVMEEVHRGEKKCAFIVMGNFSDDKIINRAISLGAKYYLMKPVEASVVIDRAAEVAGEGVPVRRESLERRRANSLDERISNIFISIGIPPHIKGYGYLREGIKMAVEDPHVHQQRHEGAVPRHRREIPDDGEQGGARHPSCHRSRVEPRAHRRRQRHLRRARLYRHRKAAHSEFIALVADKLILENMG